MKVESAETPAGRRGKCPRCGSRSVARILFGMPWFRPKLERDLEAGRIVFGGCLVAGDDPNRHCNHCRHRWLTRRRRVSVIV